VTVYDYNYQGTLIAVKSYYKICPLTSLCLSNYETDWVLGSNCQSGKCQTIEKTSTNDKTNFSFADSFDNVMMLKKIRDGNYLFSFSKGSGINLWKINARGSLKAGTPAEGFFFPNPAKDVITFIGNSDTYNHGATVKIYDMLGHHVRDYSFLRLEPIVLDLSGLREGLYPYYIITDEGVEFKGKFVIDKKTY